MRAIACTKSRPHYSHKCSLAHPYVRTYTYVHTNAHTCVRLLGNRDRRGQEGETEKEGTGGGERERSNGDGSSNQCREMEYERNGASEEARPGENLLHLWHGTWWTMKKEREREKERASERERGRGHGRVGLLLIEEHEVALWRLRTRETLPRLFSSAITYRRTSYCVTCSRPATNSLPRGR